VTSGRGAKIGGRFSALLTAVLVIFAYLLAVEVVLRFLPVATGLHGVAVDEAQPVYHFEANRDFVYSRGWNLRDVVRGRINNAGWVNEQDYVRDDKLPLIAVIGDSYIEAQMVPYAETLQGRLAAALKGRARVYSFAASGAPLSQFAVYAAHAVREFGASAVVVNIANYDFLESDTAYRQTPGMWVYDRADADARLRLISYHPSWWRRMARHSALIRYLLLNLNLDRPLMAAHLIAGLAPIREAVAAEPDVRLAASSRVIPLFFRDLARLTGLPPSRVLFVMDGAHYPHTLVNEDTARIRQSFREAAQAGGYETIDLQPLFLARYKQQATVFEIPGDPHWNGEGHAIAAEGVMSSRLIANLPAPPH